MILQSFIGTRIGTELLLAEWRLWKPSVKRAQAWTLYASFR